MSFDRTVAAGSFKIVTICTYVVINMSKYWTMLRTNNSDSKFKLLK